MNSIQHVQNVVRLFIRRYSIASGIILILILAGGIIMQLEQNQLAHDAHLINLAGRQHALTMRISRDVLMIESSSDADIRHFYEGDLTKTLTQWQTTHNGLATADSHKGFAAAQSPTSAALFTQLEPHHQALLSAVQVVLTLTATTSSSTPLPFQTVLQESDIFVAIMDRIVTNYETESAARTLQASHYGLFTLIGIVTILGLQTLMVFRPVVKQVSKGMSELDTYIVQETRQTLHTQQLNEAMEEMLEEISVQREELHRQRNFMDVLFDHISPDVVFIIGDVGTIIRCNNALIDLFGYTRDEIIDHTGEVLFGSEEAYQITISDVMGSTNLNKAWNGEMLWYTRDGSSIAMELSLCWVEAVQSIIVIGRNIVERRRMDALLQETLAESEQRSNDLTTVFNTVQDGLVVYNMQLQEIRRNKTAELMLGTPAANTVLTDANKRLNIASIDGNPVSFNDYPITRVLRGEANPDTILLRVRRHNTHQQLIIESGAVPLRDHLGNLKGGLAHLRNVTEAYRQERQLSILRAVAKACSIAAEQRTVAQTALEVLVHELGVARGIIVLHNDERPGYPHILASSATEEGRFRDGHEQIAQVHIEDFPITLDSPISLIQTLASGKPVFDIPMASEVFVNTFLSTEVPLRFSGKIIGVLGLAYTERQHALFGVPNHEIIVTAADEIATALERARLYEDVKRLAWQDALTGLANHRALQQVIQQEAAQTDRSGSSMGLIMLDVDHFRRFNETYGHAIGDLALHTVAQAIQNTVRGSDTAARYGGEEFSVVLPHTTSKEVLIVAERVRQAIAASLIVIEGMADPVPVTASLGCAVYPTDAATTADLFKAADLALYESKHQGRNCVHTFTPMLAANASEVLPNAA